MTTDGDLGITHLVDVEAIGHGGFSWVYAATDTQLRRRVAVKVLDELKDDADRQRFDRECEILGRLSSHPNIVTVHSAGYTDGGRPYLIMELVEGGSIDDLLHREGRMPWTAAVDTILPVAAALQSAHDQGVLHRDVKPENILLSDRQPYLADFGIATLRDRAGATSTKVTASWLHAPPETFENTRDERSDLYSLASTLYAMISGGAPFWRPDEDSLNPLVYRLMHEPAPALDPSLAPAALDQLLQACLAKNPDHRPQSVDRFASQLAEIRNPGPAAPAARDLEGATRVVAPPSAEPGVSPDSPSRLPLLVGGLVAAVVLVGGAVFALSNGGGDGGTSGDQQANPLLDDGVIPSGPTTVPEGDGATPTSAGATPISDPSSSTTGTTRPEETTTTLSLSARQAAHLTGTWQGTYLCSQGVTGLTLSLDAATNGAVRGLFEFYAVPENPGLPDGSFTMNGDHGPGRLTLQADEWLQRPTNYLPADLSANLGGEREPISGLITISTGTCTVFSVEKIDDAVPTIP